MQQPVDSEGPQSTTNESPDNLQNSKTLQKFHVVEAKEQQVTEASNEESKAEKRRRRIYRTKLIIALLPAQFLASVDWSIVSTALTTIASHFGTFRLSL